MPPAGEDAVQLVPTEASLANLDEQARATLPVLPERYEILSLLGRGGMGVVYRESDRTSGDVVALKVLLEARASAVARFAREAAVLSGLDHPRIVVGEKEVAHALVLQMTREGGSRAKGDANI